MKIVWKESGVIWKYVQVTPRLYWKYAQLTLDSPENIFKRLRSHFMGESIQSAKPVFSWGSLVGSATAREILNFILHRAWQHANLRCHITIVRMAGALLIVPLRALTLQRCRIGVGGILGQYQYYCVLCLVTHNAGFNVKSTNQEVSGFGDQWGFNVIVDFNEI